MSSGKHPQRSRSSSATDPAEGRNPAPIPIENVVTESKLSERQRNEIDQDLRRRLAPQASFRSIRRQVLDANGWDLIAAHQQYTTVLARIMQSLLPLDALPAGVAGPPSSDAALYSAMHSRRMRYLLVPDSLEEQRRRLTNEFDRQLNLGRTPPNQIHLALTEALLLVHIHHYDIDVALDAFESHRVALATLHAEFDHFRPGLGSDQIVKTKGPIQERQDESLAHLASITGRSDWFSLQRHLIKHHWNLVDAVEAWYKTGIPIVDKIPKGITHKYRLNHKLDYYPAPSPDSIRPNSAIGGWRREPREYMSNADYANGLLSGTYKAKERPERQSEKSRKGTPFGFAIDATRESILPGPPDWKRFIVEYFRKGMLKKDRFSGNKTFVSELGGTREDGDPPEFDWYNPAHVAELNDWIKQVLRRATGIIMRPPTQTWTEEEKKFLFDLHMERLEQLKEKYKDDNKTEDELLDVGYGSKCMNDWADRINQAFPRDHPRPGRAIDTMRRRIPEIVKRFKLTPDRKWVQLSDEEEAEEEEDAESDAGEGPSGSKRRRKHDESEEEADMMRKKSKGVKTKAVARMAKHEVNGQAIGSGGQGA